MYIYNSYIKLCLYMICIMHIIRIYNFVLLHIRITVFYESYYRYTLYEFILHTYNIMISHVIDSQQQMIFYTWNYLSNNSKLPLTLIYG